MLEQMMADQKAYLGRLQGFGRLDLQNQIEMVRVTTLSLIKEATEVLDLVPWKIHRQSLPTRARKEIIGEIVDCFKFCTNYLIIFGVTPAEFSKAWNAKTTLNNERLDKDAKTFLNGLTAREVENLKESLASERNARRRAEFELEQKEMQIEAMQKEIEGMK